jgi:AcrR family transcriptional regulator
MSEIPAQSRILAAALAILEADGAPAVTLRRITETTGLTSRVIHQYFPNLQAILEAVVDEQFAVLYADMRRRTSRGTPRARLTGIVEAYLQYAFDHPRLFDYLFIEPRPGARRYPQDFKARASINFNPLTDLIASRMATGCLHQDDPAEVALEVWALTHGYLALFRAGRFSLTQPQFRTLIRRAVERLLIGLQTPD